MTTLRKREFLQAAMALSLLPLTSMAQAKPVRTGPTLLTIGGEIGRHNRGAVDMQLDQMMVKHGVKFAQAFTFDWDKLQTLPHVTIQPTLEYDNKPHKLRGPLLTSVLSAAGVNLDQTLRIDMRAVDGYSVSINLAEIKAYRMIIATHLDNQPLALGGLGPLWAVYDADNIAEFRNKPVKERFALCPWALYYLQVVRLS
jgi:hypothetical protein